jgi:hypothetical protein
MSGAANAWKIVGGVIGLTVLFLLIREIPSMIREVRIMTM